MLETSQLMLHLTGAQFHINLYLAMEGTVTLNKNGLGSKMRQDSFHTGTALVTMATDRYSNGDHGDGDRYSNGDHSDGDKACKPDYLIRTTS